VTWIDSPDGPWSETQIRERAFRIYQMRNPSEGDALSDWLQAEKELITEYQSLLGHRRTPHESARRSRTPAVADRVRSVEPSESPEKTEHPPLASKGVRHERPYRLDAALARGGGAT